MPKPARTTRSTRSAKTAKSVSLRAFAARVGVTHPAVVKAIKAGRLAKSVEHGADGKPKIADIELAVREWKSGASRPAPAKSGSVARPAPPVIQVPTPPPPPGDEPPTTEGIPETLTEAQLRCTYQREVKLQLENELRRGTLIDAIQAKRESFELARTVRDAILNVPDRVAAELAAETDPVRVFARLEAELRAALVGLAEALSAPPDPEPVPVGVADGE